MNAAAGQFCQLEMLDENTYRVVENDSHGQYAFLYVILMKKNCFVIDTGTGKGDYYDYVMKNINKGNLPITVICTHSHFDHIGGNCFFYQKEHCRNIMMGRNDQNYCENMVAHVIAEYTPGRQWVVTKWLEDHEIIYDNNPDDDDSTDSEVAFEVIFTPGHTRDSICLLQPSHKRVFTGDSVYPFTAMPVENMDDYSTSLRSLREFLGLSVEHAERVIDPKCTELCSMLGMSAEDFVQMGIDVNSLLMLSDGSVSQAVDMFLSTRDQIAEWCPILPQDSTGTPDSKAQTLSCGHVESNFPIENLSKLIEFVDGIRGKYVFGNPTGGGESEYSSDTFTIIASI